MQPIRWPDLGPTYDVGVGMVAIFRFNCGAFAVGLLSPFATPDQAADVSDCVKIPLTTPLRESKYRKMSVEYSS